MSLEIKRKKIGRSRDTNLGGETKHSGNNQRAIHQ